MSVWLIIQYFYNFKIGANWYFIWLLHLVYWKETSNRWSSSRGLQKYNQRNNCRGKYRRQKHHLPPSVSPRSCNWFHFLLLHRLNGWLNSHFNTNFKTVFKFIFLFFSKLCRIIVFWLITDSIKYYWMWGYISWKFCRHFFPTVILYFKKYEYKGFFLIKKCFCTCCSVLIKKPV